MEIDLTQLTSGAKAQIDFEYVLEPDDGLVKKASLIKWNPIHANGKIYLVDDKFYAYLYFTYDYTRSCDRCLEPSTNTVSDEVTILLKDQANIALEIDGNDVEFNEDISYYDNYYYNPRSDILECSFLALPSKHLCDEDCRGICPSCGVNLNEYECDCKKDEVDSRMEILKELLNRD